MHKKKGDTLIEVALAIGIFSMVAIVIISVVTASTSGAQSSLELTLTREEMDVQAEAIRFIHEGYSSGSQSSDTSENPYAALWRKLISGSYTDVTPIVSSKPATCSGIYNASKGLLSNDYGTSAFVINTRRLSNPSDVDNIVIKNTGNGSSYGYDSSGSARGPFYIASTYPRIIYSSGSRVANDNLLDQTEQAANLYNNIWRAEGIFVVPFRGSSKMYIYDTDAFEDIPYYDFYISACWMAPGADRASTLATIVRLYDYLDGGSVKVTYNYGSHSNSPEWPSPDPNSSNDYASQSGKRVILRKIENVPKGWTVKWRDQYGNLYDADGKTAITNTDPDKKLIEYVMTPVWTHIKYYLKYDINYPYANDGSVTNPPDQICYEDEPCVLSNKALTASGYQFQGWCTGEVNTFDGSCTGKSYSAGQTLPSSAWNPSIFNNVSNTVSLKAIWKMNNETIRIYATWDINTSLYSGSQYGDYDTYIKGQKFDGSWYDSNYGNPAVGEVINGVRYTLAELDHDGGYSTHYSDYSERFEINTLGGRKYYYYVYNRPNHNLQTDKFKVVIKRKDGSSWTTLATYNAPDCTASKPTYWNVFAFKDGQLVPKNTCSGVPDIGY